MPAGRHSDYDPAYCDQVVEFLRDGYSLAAFAGSIGVSRSTVYNWADAHPEFAEAVKAGQAAAIWWWEKANRSMALTGEGNATSIIFALKNRAADDWREKVETQHSGEVAISNVTRTIVDPAGGA